MSRIANGALVCAVIWLCGCTRTARERCDLPPAAPGLVIALAHHVVPQVGPDANPHVELGQLTDATGGCDASAGACVRTTTDALGRCYRRLRDQIGSGFAVVVDASVSPHYGGLFMTLTWRGGRCEFGDAPGRKLTDPDARRFNVAYDTTVECLLAAKGDAGAR